MVAFAVMKEARSRAENIPPQHPICTLAIGLPEYTGPLPTLRQSPLIGFKKDDSKTPNQRKIFFCPRTQSFRFRNSN